MPRSKPAEAAPLLGGSINSDVEASVGRDDPPGGYVCKALNHALRP